MTQETFPDVPLAYVDPDGLLEEDVHTDLAFVHFFDDGL
jgi:hypothetical protein